MVRRLITDPDEYLRERIKYPRLRTQVLIVFLAGVAITAWRLSRYVIWRGAAQYITDPILMLTVGEVGLVVIAWLLLALIWHYLAAWFGGGTSYGRMLRASGYGFAPLIVAGAIWSTGYGYALANASNPPQPPDIGGPQSPGFQHYYAQYEEFVVQVQDDPLVLVALGIGALFVLWAGYLWQRAVLVAGETNERVAGVAALLGMTAFLVRAFAPIL